MAGPTARRLPGSGRAIDLTALKDVLRDERTWKHDGVVWAEDGVSHYEIVYENGVPVDVLIDVKLIPSDIPVTCRLTGLAGGPGLGIWGIPAIGTQVSVSVPRGAIDGGCHLVACVSSERIPDGLDLTTYVVAVPPGGRVLIHDGTAAEAVPLATKADVQALRDYVDELRGFISQQFDPVFGHVHTSSPPTTPTSGPAAPPTPGAYTPPGLAPVPVPQPSGTTVLKGK